MSSLEYLTQLIKRTFNIIVGLLMLSFVGGLFFKPLARPYQKLLEKGFGVEPENVTAMHELTIILIGMWGIVAILNGGKKK